ncbi:MAG TPA: hypothetical protein VHC96_12225 [Puia sp.]|nr:hypothetical protein [Puia sp.]
MKAVRERGRGISEPVETKKPLKPVTSKVTSQREAVLFQTMLLSSGSISPVVPV